MSTTGLSAMADVEHRMGLQPVEELLDERRTYIDRVADLRARYGPFGTHDDLRKIELSRIKALIRAQAVRDKRGVLAQGVIDDEAHAHPDYMDFITTATYERAQWVKLEAKIEAVDAIINRGQAIARFVAAEARMAA